MWLGISRQRPFESVDTMDIRVDVPDIGAWRLALEKMRLGELES